MIGFVAGLGAAAVVIKKKNIAIFTYNHWVFSLDMKTKLVEHVPGINIMHSTYDSMTSIHDSMTNNHLWGYTWKQKLFSMSQGSTLSIWHLTAWHHDIKTWHHDKQSILRLHRKTKVVQHVPRINIKHLTSWHHNTKTWQHDQQSLLRLHLKTKVVQHVPRINIKHLKYDIMALLVGWWWPRQGSSFRHWGERQGLVWKL